jgi:hypothetical protein
MATRRIVVGSVAAGLASALTLMLMLERLRDPLQDPLTSFFIVVGGVIGCTLLMTAVSSLAVGLRR